MPRARFQNGAYKGKEENEAELWLGMHSIP